MVECIKLSILVSCILSMCIMLFVIYNVVFSCGLKSILTYLLIIYAIRLLSLFSLPIAIDHAMCIFSMFYVTVRATSSFALRHSRHDLWTDWAKWVNGRLEEMFYCILWIFSIILLVVKLFGWQGVVWPPISHSDFLFNTFNRLFHHWMIDLWICICVLKTQEALK